MPGRSREARGAHLAQEPTTRGIAVNMDEANGLRARIATLVSQGLEPNEISAQTGCSLSTVYKVLRAPGPDRRVLRRAPGNRTGTDTVAAIATLASADPGRSA